VQHKSLYLDCAQHACTFCRATGHVYDTDGAIDQQRSGQRTRTIVQYPIAAQIHTMKLHATSKRSGQPHHIRVHEAAVSQIEHAQRLALGQESDEESHGTLEVTAAEIQHSEMAPAPKLRSERRESLQLKTVASQLEDAQGRGARRQSSGVGS
jgi:hypothetical protein